MARDNAGDGDLPSSLSASSSAAGPRRTGRSKPYDPNNSFVKKVASKVTDLLPQPSWISKWFNTSQDESALNLDEPDDSHFENCEEQIQAPPLKRPRIRMDVTHPPGTFLIKPRNKNQETENNHTADHFKHHYINNNTTSDHLLESTATGTKLHSFLASTPAITDLHRHPEARAKLNLPMTDRNSTLSNGIDNNSDSGDSTSGCSSLIGQNIQQEIPKNTIFNSPFATKKRFLDEKLTTTNYLQSPRTLFLENTNRDSLSSRRPSFDASVASQKLDKSGSLSSPFYRGMTMFGGANAANLYSRSSSLLNETSQCLQKRMRVPKRASVDVKPINETTVDSSGMSHTAKRILEALEHFSSPISDVKKIPLKNTSAIFSPSTSRKRFREEETPTKVGLRHVTRDLTIPTVPDFLKIRRRQRLQNTTIAARKMFTENKNCLNEEYQLPTDEQSPQGKRNSELKAKKKNNIEDQETVKAVNLPSIPLPISSLPRFDIALPQKPKHPDNDFKFASPIKLATQSKIDSPKQSESFNNFIFSKPLSPSKINRNQDSIKTITNMNQDHSSEGTFTNFIWNGPTETMKPKEKTKDNAGSSMPKVAKELKLGSVMDVLGKNIQSTTSLWECSECLIKNNNNVSQCIACKAEKPSKIIDSVKDTSSHQFDKIQPIALDKNVNPTNLNNSCLISKETKTGIGADKTKLNQSNAFGSPSLINKSTGIEPENIQFKTLKNSWECPSCMVSNTESLLSCPCCNTAKPGTSNIKPLTKNTIVHSGFGDKFKKPEGSWLCDTCLVSNKPDAIKCIACEMERKKPTKSSKESGFGDKFKKPEGSWECSTCFVLNNADKNKCSACETLKASNKLDPKTASTFGDKFKKPQGSWSCEVCMIVNKAEVEKCAACETPKAGSQAKPTNTISSSSSLTFKIDIPNNSSNFTFGINQADSKKDLQSVSSKANGLAFGSAMPTSTTKFSFGVPSTIDSEESKLDKEMVNKAPANNIKISSSQPFTFGVKSVDSEPSSDNKLNDTSSATSTLPSEKINSKPSATFIFGASNSEGKKSPVKIHNDVTEGTTGFTFGNVEKKISTTALVPTTVEDQKEKINKAVIDSKLKVEANLNEQKQSTDSVFKSISSNQPQFKFGDNNNKNNDSVILQNSSITNEKSASNSLWVPVSNSSQNQTSTFGTSTVKSDNTTMLNFDSKKSLSSTSTTESSNLFKKTASPLFTNTKTNENTTSFGKFNSTSTKSSPGETKDKTPIFGGAENKTQIFGEPTSKPVNSANDSEKPVFGSPNSSSNIFSSKPSIFGSNNNSNATPFGSPTPNIFGSTSVLGTNQVAFPASKPVENTTPSPGVFSFGSSSQNSPAAGLNFSAGSNAPLTDQKKIFSFGANANNNSNPQGFGSSTFKITSVSPVTPVTSNFSFNNPKSDSTTFGQASSPAPMFSAPGAPLSLGQNQSSAFSSPTTPSTPATNPVGFNFQNPSQSSGFNFGTPSSQPALGGFKFNAPGTASPVVAFDPNSTQTFNFTGGSAPKEFKASPAVIQERKFKKAVRRMR